MESIGPTYDGDETDDMSPREKFVRRHQIDIEVRFDALELATWSSDSPQ